MFFFFSFLAALPSSIPALPIGPTGDAADLALGQQLADDSIANSAIETIPAPDQPCKVETSTEVIQHPGETFVHQPGEILINQPPTRLTINHAPYIVRPSPIVLNSGGKTITNAYTRKILPSAIQLRPVIVRIVKPIEKKVLIEKSATPGGQTYESTPVFPDQCSTSLALATVADTAALTGAPIVGLPAASPDLALPAPIALPALPASPALPALSGLPATAPAALDYQSLLASPVNDN